MAELTKENVLEMFEGDEEWKYFVAFIKGDTNEIIHIVGFMEQPHVSDVLNAILELKTDDEFGMPADVVESLVIRIFSFPD